MKIHAERATVLISVGVDDDDFSSAFFPKQDDLVPGKLFIGGTQCKRIQGRIVGMTTETMEGFVVRWLVYLVDVDVEGAYRSLCEGQCSLHWLGGKMEIFSSLLGEKLSFKEYFLARVMQEELDNRSNQYHGRFLNLLGYHGHEDIEFDYILQKASPVL